MSDRNQPQVRALQDANGLMNSEVVLLRRRIRDLEEALARSSQINDAKTKRIMSLVYRLKEAGVVP